MRALSFGLLLLALGVTSVGSASAQSRDPQFDGDRNGPPPYFTGQQPRPDSGRPANWPPASAPREQQPPPSYRRTGPPPPMPDNDQRGRVVAPRPPVREVGPPPRGPQEREGEPVARVAVGADQMVISITEYRSLQDQARELQRMLGNSSRDFRETPPSRDYDPRETYR